MRAIPLDIGPIHFVGIGGIGMSGIAEILHNLGYKVQGSDIADNANVKRLREQGIEVMIGHAEENVASAEVLVISSAIKPDNPELQAAREKLIPVVRRAEMLGELMHLKWAIAVGGTHGKTTTTSLISSMMDAAGFDPTIVNGGIINAYGTNAKLGDGEWIVVEADESDGSFIKLPATVAVVTNIDPEHMEHYGEFETLLDAFDTFIKNLPFYGFACLCIDHPEVQAMIPRVRDRKVITYGLSAQAEVRAKNVEIGRDGAVFDVVFTDRDGEKTRMEQVHLPMLGTHNVVNSLAVIAIARELKVKEDILRKGLADFAGVKRRFTKTGEVDGITIIDDYGHHPVEIEAVLSAARDAVEDQVIAVMQPHRYSRLSDLFEDFCTCFNDADVVIVADVYSAGKDPIDGVDKEALVEGLRDHGHRRALALESEDDLAAIIKEIANPGDMVICLGAGNITAWAQALPGQLEALQ